MATNRQVTFKLKNFVLKRNLFLFFFIAFIALNVSGQQQKFLEDFKQVKLHLANHKEDEAIPILENLFKENPTNFNIAYLLGYCYVKQEKQIDRAIRLLSVASRSYSDLYDPTSLTEKRVSEYVYYYLIIAYSLDGRCDEAKETLNQFYKIYSYYDEWYLVEGQKWLRECGTHQLKEDTLQEDTTTDVAIAEAEKLTRHLVHEGEVVIDPSKAIAADKARKAAENTPKEVIMNEEPKKMEEKPRVPVLADNQPTQGFKDRLTLVEPNNSNSGYKPAPVNRDQRGIITKTISYSTPSILYGVQVAAHLEPKFTRDFNNVKNVDVYIDKNGVFRYVIGRFPYRMQAEKLLEYVKDAGYGDAFIVDINGDKYKEEVVSVDNENINNRISGKVDFRVQIGAFKEKIPEHVARQYLIVDHISETQVGDFTVLTIGSFDSYEASAAYRDKIQMIGIEDAFIVAFNYDKKIPIDEAEKFLLQKKLERIEDAASEGKMPKERKLKPEDEVEAEELSAPMVSEDEKKEPKKKKIKKKKEKKVKSSEATRFDNHNEKLE